MNFRNLLCILKWNDDRVGRDGTSFNAEERCYLEEGQDFVNWGWKAKRLGKGIAISKEYNVKIFHKWLQRAIYNERIAWSRLRRLFLKPGFSTILGKGR